MKCFEMPAPKWRRQYSSKFFGSAAARRRDLRLDDAQQALLDHLGRQAVQVGLERIAREHAVRKDARLARDRHHLARQELVDQLLDGRIAQVQPVAGLVEAVAVALVGARVPAQALLLLEQHPGRAQVHRRRDAGEAAAQNDDPSAALFLVFFIPGGAYFTRPPPTKNTPPGPREPGQEDQTRTTGAAGWLFFFLCVLSRGGPLGWPRGRRFPLPPPWSPPRRDRRPHLRGPRHRHDHDGAHAPVHRPGLRALVVRPAPRQGGGRRSTPTSTTSISC